MVMPRDDLNQSETYVGQKHLKIYLETRKANSTTRNKEMKQNVDYEITWKILERAKPFSPVSRICNLCTKEKYFIIFEPEKASLNKKEELNNHCLHKFSQLLDRT